MKYSKGLQLDTTPVDQPEGSWRYARNATMNKKAGGISNEGGVEQAQLASLSLHSSNESGSNWSDELQKR